MKDFLLPLFGLQTLAMTPDEYSFWDRMAERWGIGLVGLVLLYFLARWTSKREEKVTLEREKREKLEREEREKREISVNQERISLLQRNNELQELAMEAHQKHSLELKNIIKDGNKHQADVGIELKNIARRVNCPPACSHKLP